MRNARLTFSLHFFVIHFRQEHISLFSIIMPAAHFPSALPLRSYFPPVLYMCYPSTCVADSHGYCWLVSRLVGCEPLVAIHKLEMVSAVCSRVACIQSASEAVKCMGPAARFAVTRRRQVNAQYMLFFPSSARLRRPYSAIHWPLTGIAEIA